MYSIPGSILTHTKNNVSIQRRKWVKKKQQQMQQKTEKREHIEKQETAGNKHGKAAGTKGMEVY